MIVRITRVKVGQRQAPITAPCSSRYRGFCIWVFDFDVWSVCRLNPGFAGVFCCLSGAVGALGCLYPVDFADGEILTDV